MNIKLVNGRALILDKMPELIDLSSNGIDVEIVNANKAIVTIEYDDTYIQVKSSDNKITLPLNIMLRDVKKIYFTHNDRKYVADVEKLKLKGISNLKDKDTLVELLALMYNKYNELEAKYNKLEAQVNCGDLMI